MYSINSVTIVGRLGADAEIRSLQNGDKVATLSIATDHSYKDKQSGEWIKRTEWHRVVTFQQGLVAVLEKHAGVVSPPCRACCAPANGPGTVLSDTQPKLR